MLEDYMPGLYHQIIYRENENLLEEEWEKMEYYPLSIDGVEILKEDYFEIHDDIIRWFLDIFNWIEMYNPSKKELTNGFCYYGVTIIKIQNITKMDKIINSIISLFENSPLEITLTGDYCISDKCYSKIKIDKNKMLEMLIKFKSLVKKVINSGGYILHCGI
jgi:hypothetical protein